ncbi:MAG: arsenate reductase ArsC [Deltaproteobacteria bacterium]|jgi:arsenate reductase (thioredoxin)|nr:arsenate reductase ArsC [Deltaproteobacteria bacterium]MBT4526012.1 arsenate reductase ArsC [Deltaproteobacteria bacterium]
MKDKLKLLFLCTGNSCRSQMAEGFANHLKGDLVEAYSAGIETHGLNPNAVKVMQELGIDISTQQSKLIGVLKNLEFDYVVTVCDSAHENCPFYPAKVRIIHHRFSDPPKMAARRKKESEKLECYRIVRDEIKKYILELPRNLNV